VGAAAGQLLTPKHIQCRLTHAQPAFPLLYMHAWPRLQVESGVGWLPGQLLGQYQMPRSHTQRCVVEPERHCDWPAVLHCVPTPGSVDTTSQRVFVGAPPVEVPPEFVMPPDDVVLPPVGLTPPVGPVAPPVALPPVVEGLPPTWPPPVPLVDVVPPAFDVPPAELPLAAAFPPVSPPVAGGALESVPQAVLKAVSAPSSVTLNRPSVLMS